MCCAVPCHAMPCQCYARLFYAVLWHAMSPYAMLCQAWLCFHVAVYTMPDHAGCDVIACLANLANTEKYNDRQAGAAKVSSAVHLLQATSCVCAVPS